MWGWSGEGRSDLVHAPGSGLQTQTHTLQLIIFLSAIIWAAQYSTVGDSNISMRFNKILEDLKISKNSLSHSKNESFKKS